MGSKASVMKWIRETFDDLREVIIEDYGHLPYGKKVTDYTDDYVIVYYDDGKGRVNYIFKEKDKIVTQMNNKKFSHTSDSI
ncbi:hypothetical protein [Lentibacillus sediminis]|uniref:hypothetical protein n=1 Tax=Lentibacillus sediminis TaxID=1940529 RepID=UPI000C1BF2B1|nr:hypothetical protein [Lentibacillus sediminis]